MERPPPLDARGGVCASKLIGVPVDGDDMATATPFLGVVCTRNVAGISSCIDGLRVAAKLADSLDRDRDIFTCFPPSNRYGGKLSLGEPDGLIALWPSKNG